MICADPFARGQAVTVSFSLRHPFLGDTVERVAGRVANFHADDNANRVGVVFLEPLRPATNPALTRVVGDL